MPVPARPALWQEAGWGGRVGGELGLGRNGGTSGPGQSWLYCRVQRGSITMDMALPEAGVPVSHCPALYRMDHRSPEERKDCYQASKADGGSDS